MNRTKRFFYNSVMAATLQIVKMIAGFITPKIMISVYGSEINGLVSSVAQFVGYFSLVEAGIAGAAIFALYKPLADSNHKAINAVVSVAKRFYMQSGYIFVACTVLLSAIYPFFVHTASLNFYSISILVLILGVTGAMEFFTMAKYRVLLSADQRLYVISFVTIISIILNTLIIYILAKYRMNIVLLRGFALTSVFSSSFILYFYVRAKYKFISYKEKASGKLLDKRWNAFYIQILQSVQIGAPVVLLTFFSSLKTVSVYTVYNMVILGITGILGIFMSGLSSSFGDVIARNEHETLKRATKEFDFYFYSILTVMYGVTMTIIMPFIRLYTRGVTDTNYNLPVIGFLFVINGLLSSIKTPQGMLVISAGLFKETRRQTTIQALIIIVAGAVLTPLFGITGVLIASCLSNLYRTIDLMFYIPHTVTKLPVRDTFFSYCRILISLAIIWVSSTFISFNPYSYMNLLGFAIVAGAFSTVVVFLMTLVFERQQLKNVFKRAKSIVGIK